jgi:hypothetical protein
MFLILFLYNFYIKMFSSRRKIMTNEHRFFERLAGLASPAWDVQLSDKLHAPGLDLAGRSVRLYLVDTSTSWTAAGAFAPAGFALAADAAKASGLQGSKLADAAGQALGQLGRTQPGPGDHLEKGLQLAAAALTNTQTFQLVTGKGRGLAGHWVYMAYRGHDASITCRPLYFNAHEMGFVPPEALYSMVRQVVRQDLAPGSSVAKLLKRAGGALLAPMFK